VILSDRDRIAILVLLLAVLALNLGALVLLEPALLEPAP
jgi:hypothetical protein